MDVTKLYVHRTQEALDRGQRDFADYVVHLATCLLSRSVLGDGQEQARGSLGVAAYLFQMTGSEPDLWESVRLACGEETAAEARGSYRELLLSYLSGEKQLWREDEDPV